MTARNIATIISSFLLISCNTLKYEKISINGMVYDFSNRPVSNYSIIIDDEPSSITDINGRFAISKIKRGNYKIRGTGKEYEEYQSEISIYAPDQIIYIRVPSYKQLIELADNALMNNQIRDANSYILRAYDIGIINTELLFYAAIVKFRMNDYSGAIYYLELAIASGIDDDYMRMFYDDLKRLQDESTD